MGIFKQLNTAHVLMVLIPLFIFLFLVVCIWCSMKESFAKRTTGICSWICFMWRPHKDAETTSSSRNRESGIRMREERTSRLLEIYSTAYQETSADPSNSSRTPQNSQQSLSVNLPPEIILTPSPHIINSECDNDKPPSYESLYNLG